MTRLVWKKLVFLAGDIRRIGSFPWVTWAANHHKVCFSEILEALPHIKYGDIGLHRDCGYFSNLAIPGFMKHGWVHVGTGDRAPMVVEAISDGVLFRSSIYPMYSDYTVILSPKNVTDEERRGACKKAKQIVGTEYDVDFTFDIERELNYYTGQCTLEAKEDLSCGERYLQKFDPAFSCTEVCSYAWWHKREDLRLFRKPRRGREVIIADDFMNRSFEIRWMSRSITVDVAQKHGLHEEGLSMVEDYISGRSTL
jgi:hypothetical protein